jgi:DNA-binding Lrp family transcriptional regulator
MFRPLREVGRTIVEFDRIDLEILARLQGNGRLTNRQLAEAVALSESACHARVRRLERSGVIRGYFADIASEALGDRLTIYAEVTLAHHRAADFALFDRLLTAIPEVVEAVQVSGPADYVLKAVVPDIDAWSRISDAMLDKGVSIANVRTTVVMKTTKRFAGLPLPSATSGR